MATGLSNKLVGQTGEFLVCAELGRRGFVATPFSGNVPGYDIIATDGDYRSVPIQVKTSNGAAWKFSGDKLLRIEFDPTTEKQRVLGVRDVSHADLVHVFVWLGHTKSAPDRFFILRKREFVQAIYDHYVWYLDKHGGRRPKKPSSTFTALRTPDLEAFEGGWELVEDRLRPGV